MLCVISGCSTKWWPSKIPSDVFSRDNPMCGNSSRGATIHEEGGGSPAEQILLPDSAYPTVDLGILDSARAPYVGPLQARTRPAALGLASDGERGVFVARCSGTLARIGNNPLYNSFWGRQTESALSRGVLLGGLDRLAGSIRHQSDRVGNCIHHRQMDDLQPLRNFLLLSRRNHHPGHNHEHHTARAPLGPRRRRGKGLVLLGSVGSGPDPGSSLDNVAYGAFHGAIRGEPKPASVGDVCSRFAAFLYIGFP